MLVTTCGFLVADIVAAGMDKVAEPGELVYVPGEIKLHIGGHPANVGVDLAKLGVPGDEVTVIGAIGDDLFGDFIENTLKSYGLRTKLQRIKGVGTTKDMILVAKGEDRRYHVDEGASLKLEPEFVISSIEEEPPLLFYAATGIVGRFDDEIERVMAAAKGKGCFTFLDIVKPWGKDWDFVLPALKFADVFHCNDMEARSVTGEGELEGAARKLIESGVKLLLVTMGERGAMAVTRSFLVSQPPFRIEPIDPTGAGDAFCAGAIKWLLDEFGDGLRSIDPGDLRPNRLIDLLAFCQAVGATACMGVGTTSGVSIDGARRLIEEQGSRVKEGSEVKSLG
ncbi:hypothetical protein DRP77_06100 [Candidatus Poribacteria bacterium]|nr:MAG: hypothetical protein DRP77_06100 [Candidatus Poribacteria bacterium]